MDVGSTYVVTCANKDIAINHRNQNLTRVHQNYSCGNDEPVKM